MRIRCAKCDKPVDRITIIAEPGRVAHTIVAECHGDRDEMRLTLGFMMGLSPAEMQRLENSEGVAFSTKRIAAV